MKHKRVDSVCRFLAQVYNIIRFNESTLQCDGAHCKSAGLSPQEPRSLNNAGKRDSILCWLSWKCIKKIKKI